MVDKGLTAADTSAKVVDLRVSIDLAFEGDVYTLDVALTGDELEQARRGEMPERLLPMHLRPGNQDGSLAARGAAHAYGARRARPRAAQARQPLRVHDLTEGAWPR